MEDTVVFIDAAYLSKICLHFGEGNRYLSVDYNQFAITLARSQNLWCKGVYYYTAPPFQGEPPTPDEEERRRKYDKFITKLRRIPGFIVREGRCQKVDGYYHQKGVDTLVTMDLLDACHDEDIHTIIILACDTDFVPILNKLRKNSMTVILFYYNDYVRGSDFSMSNHILTACDLSVLITRDMLVRSELKTSSESQ